MRIMFRDFFYVDRGYTYMMIVLITLMVFVMMYKDEEGNSRELVSSMPFDRQQIILSKLAAGMLVILSAVLISTIIASGAYIWAGRVQIYAVTKDMLQWMILSLLTYGWIFVFIILIHSLIRNSIAASITGPVLLLAPVVVLLELELGDILTENLMKLMSGLDRSSISQVLEGLTGRLQLSAYNDSVRTFQMHRSIYDGFAGKSITLMVMTGIIAWTAVKCYKKRASVKNNSLIAFKPAEIIINSIIALMGAVTAFHLTLISWDRLLLPNLALISTFIIIYMLLKKTAGFRTGL